MLAVLAVCLDLLPESSGDDLEMSVWITFFALALQAIETTYFGRREQRPET